MALEVALDAAVGTLFAELYKGIKVLKDLIFNKCRRFESLVRDLEYTMESLSPLIEQIDYYNTIMKLSRYEGMRDLEEEMKRGIKLVSKCSAAGMWKKLGYATELDNLVKSLNSQLKIAQRVRDEKEILDLSRDSNYQLVESRKEWEKSFDLSTSHYVLGKTHLNLFTSFLTEWRSFSTANHSGVPSGVDVVLEDVSSTNQIKIEASSSLPVGLDVPLKKLKMKLLTDDQVPILVVTGLGGCGKTTLAKHFCEDNEVKGRFKKNIFFLDSSSRAPHNEVLEFLKKAGQTPLLLVLDDVWSESEFLVSLYIGMHVGACVWWSGRFKKIFFSDSSSPAPHNEVLEFSKKAGQTPLLWVLDDVWSEPEFLENLDNLNRPNLKILVTSRFEFQNFSNCLYYINPLNDEDAMTLFLHSASMGELRNSYVSKDLVRQIVEHLKGLPLAIKVVGTSFGQMSLENWHKRLKAWSMGSLILDFESNELLTCLQRSFDDMDRTKESWIKECFISLASFPKGQTIPVVSLIDMWAYLDNELFNQKKELNERDNKDYQSIHSIEKLQVLAKRSLANLVPTRSGTWDVDDMDGYYSEHFVIQHDMLRELAIYQTRQDPMEQRKILILNVFENNLPEWWTKQEHQPIRARLLSISTDSVFSTKWPNLEVPEIEVLVLNFQSNNYALPEFVEKMKTLKVLIVTNYCVSNVAELSYFGLLSSLLKLKRIRLDRISFDSIIKSSIVLRSLDKLSLFMCKVGRAFSNYSIPCPFPNLVELNIDYCNDLVELPWVVDLRLLKTLSISNCHKLSALPEGIGNNLVHLQELRLRSCTDLEKLPDSVTNLKQLTSLDISNCCSLKELPENIGELRSLLVLNMRQCSRLQALPDSVKNLEQSIKVICDDELAMLWENLRQLSDGSEVGFPITVVKDKVNLNWLPNPLPANQVVARMEKGEVTDSAPKFNTVMVKLQEEFKGDIDAVKDELSSIRQKLDGITNLLTVNLEQRNTTEPSGISGWRDSNSANSSSYNGPSPNANKSKNGTLQLPTVNLLSSMVVSERTSSQFNSWPNATRNLEISVGSREWFIRLTSGNRLIDTHVDVYLQFLRKSRHVHSQSLSQSCTILDTVFWSRMKGQWEAFQKNPSSYKWDSDTLDYPLGKSPRYTRPWSEVDYLYLPVNVGQHWVAVCCDLMRRKFTIYDSMLSANQDEFMCDELKPVATMFPSLLDQSGFYQQRPELSPLTTSLKVVRLSDNIPQQSSECCDSGVFMLKFVEYLSLGQPLSFGQADIQQFRKQMALDMFVISNDSSGI